ncbi:50S ribosomal protein L9 [Actinocrinis puniceicyclus]|uniref:Large ribosomal subunit protein bL9 n=1 Tax=Actinocrinis puniceicyclus TaxID=977794 RepID=A0A8J7WQW7_9ACTN|nr:50S ribosomal protein L9 [Actinocrinis puniceicyclus]MBS2964782.1 50S ribosomal protein L9 [Actinocrinis puniceicyclus]
MKLILTHEVSNLGSPGDVVEVKDGYGRNYLLPRGFAIAWSKGAEKQIETIRKARKAREVRDLGHAQEIKNELEALNVRLSSRAGNSGRLFGAVTVADIATAVSKAGGPALDKRSIEIPTPIKTVGSHKVSVRLHPEVAASIGLTIVAA